MPKGTPDKRILDARAHEKNAKKLMEAADDPDNDRRSRGQAAGAAAGELKRASKLRHEHKKQTGRG